MRRFARNRVGDNAQSQLWLADAPQDNPAHLPHGTFVAFFDAFAVVFNEEAKSGTNKKRNARQCNGEAEINRPDWAAKQHQEHCHDLRPERSGCSLFLEERALIARVLLVAKML